MKPLTFWQRLRRAVTDTYFVIGTAVVGLLLLAAVLGPEAAPHNPSLVKPLMWIDGELHKAPIPPGSLFPLGTDDLGRDQLSMLLYGARVTLVMALVATIMRMLLGLFLGTFAGWWQGSFFDRAITGSIELLAAIPGLILAMLLVYAIGIQRGQIAFIAALSLVGWGEVAQIVRGHVLGIRNELFIEAARATGLSPAGILSRHVLPNLLSTLLALAALEMGAVLLLLGELGFVSVFIGGGRLGFNEAAREVSHYFDIPDWGAMLGSSWRWFRSYPWYPLAPAGAFFVAVLGFNLFGYGLQRFIERGRFHPSGWSVFRFLLVVALILLGARSLLAQTGIEAQYADLAQRFDENRAWEHAVQLVERTPRDPEAVPTAPNERAEYIAAQFIAAGLSPASRVGSFFQTYSAARGQVTAEPRIEVLTAGAGAGAQYGGVSFDPWQPFHAEGPTAAELVVIGNASGNTIRSEGILLLLDLDEEVRLPWNAPPPYQGILRVVPDDQLGRNDQAPAFDANSYLHVSSLPEIPNLLVGESTARAMLAAAGLDLAELTAQLEAGERIDLSTGLQVRLQYGLQYAEAPAANVIGYIAGLDVGRRGERVLVSADYAAPLPQGGVVFPGANDTVSGVAVMLEIAQLFHDLEIIPKRTIVFVAFDTGGGDYFINHPVIPTGRSDSWTTVALDQVGAGDERLGRMESSSGLARAFDQSARRLQVRTQELDDADFFFYLGGSRLGWGGLRVHKSYQGVAIARSGDASSGTPADTLDHLDRELLGDTGRAVTHFVMVLGSR